MSLPPGILSRMLFAVLFLETAAGCQSLAKPAAVAEPAGGTLSDQNASDSSRRISASTTSRVGNSKKQSPVLLTGLTSEDSDQREGETDLAEEPSRIAEMAAKRDVRPVYFGRAGIRDPNAGADEDYARDRANPLRASPAGHQRVILFGDDPEKLFQEMETRPVGLNPGLAPDAPEREPAPFPTLIPPELEAAAPPYEQVLQYPADWINVKRDVVEIVPTLWDNTKALATWQNACIMTVAAGGAVAIREGGLDDHVRSSTKRHEERWGQGDDVFRQFGEPMWQVPVLAGFYGYTVWKQDPELYNYSRGLIQGYAISAIFTGALKGICDTQRPSDNFYNGRYGFPSFHTSSVFAIAGVTEEYYGWQAGLPLYVLGGLVGWSRIDQREHDLSDVLFGAVLGYVVGKSVGAHHIQRDGERRWNVEPYYDPLNSASGITLQTSF